MVTMTHEAPGATRLQGLQGLRGCPAAQRTQEVIAMTDTNDTPWRPAGNDGSLTRQLGLDPAEIHVFEFANGPDEPPRPKMVNLPTWPAHVAHVVAWPHDDGAILLMPETSAPMTRWTCAAGTACPTRRWPRSTTPRSGSSSPTTTPEAARRSMTCWPWPGCHEPPGARAGADRSGPGIDRGQPDRDRARAGGHPRADAQLTGEHSAGTGSGQRVDEGAGEAACTVARCTAVGSAVTGPGPLAADHREVEERAPPGP